MPRLCEFGRRLQLALVLAVSLVLSACSNSRGGPIPYATGELASPDPLTPVVLAQDYRLAPGDKLDITVFRVEDLSGEYTVDLSGNLAFPLLGVIPVMNLSPAQLGDLLTSRLAANYLQDPSITVGVLESTGRQVTIDGAVRQPGSYPVTSNLTLMRAVALARGTDEFSNPRRVAVFRRVDGERMVAAFDLTSIREGEMDDPQIYAGDIVVVAGSRNQRTLRDIFAALPVLALFRPY